MIALFSGGSGSGKSELAENYALSLAHADKAAQKKLYYFATMRVWGEEGRARVKKHRCQRAGKGFITVECPNALPVGYSGGVVLLECLSNRLANAMFSEAETPISDEEGKRESTVKEKAAAAVGEILTEIAVLAQKNDVVIVTNEVFSDGIGYGAQTAEYIGSLGRLNCALAQKADLVVESVYSIPVVHKGEYLCVR